MKSFVMDCDMSCFQALNVPITSENGFSIVNLGASDPLLNCVSHNQTNNADLEATAVKIIKQFRKLGLDHSWWLETNSEPTELERILNKHNLKRLTLLHGMALKLSSLEEFDRPSELSLNRVLTEEQFLSWSNVLAQGFEFNNSDAEIYASLYVKAGLSGHFEHLVGEKEGRTVCTGTLLSTKSGCYIYNISTLEHERKKNYATSMTHELLQMAKQKGHTRTALVSTPMAVSTYRNLGFKDICQFNIYG